MLLLWNQYFFVILVGNPKGLALTLNFHKVLEVSTRRRVLFHVALHPIRELLLFSVTKTSTLERTWLEASIKTVRRLTGVLGIAVESVGFRNAVDQDGFLKGAGALLIEDACMRRYLRSP